MKETDQQQHFYSTYRADPRASPMRCPKGKPGRPKKIPSAALKTNQPIHSNHL
jgi:hypothetical protein